MVAMPQVELPFVLRRLIITGFPRAEYKTLNLYYKKACEEGCKMGWKDHKPCKCLYGRISR